MARRATFFNQVWEEHDTILTLDAGDLFGDRNRGQQAQSEFLARQTMWFGYDALGLGERDLNYGFEFLERMIAEHGLPFTSANVRNAATGELLLPEYLIVERAGLRFGVVSVLSPTYRIATMATRDIEYQVDEPIDTLRELLPRLREQCDVVVLLSHLSQRPTEALVRELEGIDIALVGHTISSLNREFFVNETLILAAAHEGRSIGMARASIAPQTGQVMTAQVTVTTLDDRFEDDPFMLAEVEGFLQQVEDERAAKRAAFPRDRGSPDEMYLGDHNCRACHTEIHAQWRQTSHARSYMTLRARNMQFEPDCLSCHTTGYRHHNGYDEHERTNLINVQCESCHGYGTAHVRDGSMLKVARDSCTECHDNALRPCYDEQEDQDFEYARYWERIAH